MVRIIFLIFFIFLLNYLAMKFHWLSSIWYFDMPMHFLGGFWLGLFALYLFSPKNQSLSYISKVLLFVFLMGAGWEIFEIFIDKLITLNNFNYIDTASDMFFDFAGGLSAIFYFFRRAMIIKEDNI